MAQTRQRMRGEWDYLSFVYGRYWPIAASGALFLVAVISESFKEVAPWIKVVALPLTVVGLVGSCYLLVREVKGVRRDRREYALLPRDNSPAIPARVREGMMVISLGRPRGSGSLEEFALVDVGVDVHIRSMDPQVSFESSSFRLPAELGAIGNQMMLQTRIRERASGRSHRATRFNGHLIRLGSDLPRVPSAAAEVNLHSVHYFDGESSNELWTFNVQFLKEPIDNPVQRYLLTRDGDLFPLASSRLANIVGISLVAVTSDRMVLFVCQSRRNSVAPGALSASASGSLEWRDGTRQPGSLAGILLAGMKRELAEESAVFPDEISSAQLTGFYRWWNRGAKPEFCGYAETHLTWDDIRQRGVTGSEKEYTSSRIAIPLDDLVKDRSGDSQLHLRWGEALPRDVVAEAWTRCFPNDPRTAETLAVNPSCEAAWRAAAPELLRRIQSS